MISLSRLRPACTHVLHLLHVVLFSLASSASSSSARDFAFFLYVLQSQKAHSSMGRGGGFAYSFPLHPKPTPPFCVHHGDRNPLLMEIDFTEDARSKSLFSCVSTTSANVCFCLLPWREERGEPPGELYTRETPLFGCLYTGCLCRICADGSSQFVSSTLKLLELSPPYRGSLKYLSFLRRAASVSSHLLKVTFYYRIFQYTSAVFHLCVSLGFLHAVSLLDEKSFSFPNRDDAGGRRDFFSPLLKEQLALRGKEGETISTPFALSFRFRLRRLFYPYTCPLHQTHFSVYCNTEVAALEEDVVGKVLLLS